MRQIFLDTETTGLNAEQGDRIIELGCIEYDSRRPTGRTLHHYINPQRSSHPDAVRVHGITDAFLADKPVFAQVASELADFVEGAEVVIHNAAFDLGFLNAEFQRLGLGAFEDRVGRIVDSLLMARELFPGKGNSLDALCRRLEVDNSGRGLHGALLDAGLLAEVYLRMTRGQRALVIDEEEGAAGVLALEEIDLRKLHLTVLPASAEALQAHWALLAEIDKGCGGKTVWKDELAQAQAEAEAEAAAAAEAAAGAAEAAQAAQAADAEAVAADAAMAPAVSAVPATTAPA